MAGTIAQLGRMTTVPPREIWPHEAWDFTPWLLANVDVLSDLLGMDLTLDGAEHPVGEFSLDLIGRDVTTGGVVIVENQLEISDHTHLGQIITYAAGTDPKTIVWITTGFRLEHRAAIDWLNERTDEKTRVFGVVIHVVRIGDSEPAPNFELVAQPNDWEKEVRKATGSARGDVSERTQLFRQFWELLLDRVRAEHPGWTRARTTDQSWCDMSLGVSHVYVSLAFAGGALTARIYFSSPDPEANEARFDAVYRRRDEFEAALGAQPEWDRMDGRKGARIALISHEFTDVADTDRWPQMVDWLIEKQIRLRATFDAIGGVAVFDSAALRT